MKKRLYIDTLVDNNKIFIHEIMRQNSSRQLHAVLESMLCYIENLEQALGGIDPAAGVEARCKTAITTSTMLGLVNIARNTDEDGLVYLEADIEETQPEIIIEPSRIVRV